MRRIGDIVDTLKQLPIAKDTPVNRVRFGSMFPKHRRMLARILLTVAFPIKTASETLGDSVLEPDTEICCTMFFFCFTRSGSCAVVRDREKKVLNLITPNNIYECHGLSF